MVGILQYTHTYLIATITGTIKRTVSGVVTSNSAAYISRILLIICGEKVFLFYVFISKELSCNICIMPCLNASQKLAKSFHGYKVRNPRKHETFSPQIISSIWYYIQLCTITPAAHNTLIEHKSQ